MLSHCGDRTRLDVGAKPRAPSLDARPQGPLFLEDVGCLAHADGK